MFNANVKDYKQKNIPTNLFLRLMGKYTLLHILCKVACA